MTSGIRVGTPAVTTRGLKEKEMGQIVEWMVRILREGEAACAGVKAEVESLMENYPLYE